MPQVTLADIQSGIFSFLIRESLYSSEKDILDLDFHYFKYRLKQLKDYDDKVEKESERMRNEAKNRK